jgi:hypothetical protein
MQLVRCYHSQSYMKSITSFIILNTSSKNVGIDHDRRMAVLDGVVAVVDPVRKRSIAHLSIPMPHCC